MKRILSILIAFVLIASVSGYASASQAGFGNFTYSSSYTGQFHDVSGSDWYGQYVEDAYNFGFFRGKSADIFDPGGQLTLGEAVVTAARLRSIYRTGSADFAESAPFYAVYADYALEHGIIDRHGDYSAPATRAQFAQLIFNALPLVALPAINSIPYYGISDVVPNSDYGAAVYALYRAGIFAGSDRFGTFFPGSDITRAEACAIMVRIANPSTRLNITLPSRIPAEVIFQRNTDAVFMLETFNVRGNSIRTGSGFFICSSGLAVTNLHVIRYAISATITLYNGDVYNVNGVRGICAENNLAILSIDSDKTDWSYLTLADSDLIEVGNTVYALGSPRGLINTISEGIVSRSSREVGWDTLIQFTAPISFGSGGSPVLNALGQVIGVASSSFIEGQNLNLAVPANFIRELEIGEIVTLETIYQGDNTDS